jgi:hypothetical protein
VTGIKENKKRVKVEDMDEMISILNFDRLLN